MLSRSARPFNDWEKIVSDDRSSTDAPSTDGEGMPTERDWLEGLGEGDASTERSMAPSPGNSTDASVRERVLRRELDAERHRNRHLLLSNRSLADQCSRLAVENYELRYGKRYPLPGKGLSPEDAVGLRGDS